MSLRLFHEALLAVQETKTAEDKALFAAVAQFTRDDQRRLEVRARCVDTASARGGAGRGWYGRCPRSVVARLGPMAWASSNSSRASIIRPCSGAVSRLLRP